MKIRMSKLLLGILAIAGAMAIPACNDEWNDHYSSDVGINATGPTILEALKSDPNFSDFVAILNTTGYDKLLAGNRAYTVFAPTNSALAGYTEDAKYSIVESFVKNHLAYFVHGVNAYSDTTVTMLNKKVMRLDGTLFGEIQNPNILISSGNIACRNGLIHTLEGIAPYIPNLWEVIAAEAPDYNAYLRARDEKILNVAESTLDSIRVEDGKPIYLDSVVTYTNMFWGGVGYLNAEDSAYVSLILDDQAWQAAYDTVAKSFQYNPDLQYTHWWVGTGGDPQTVKDSLMNYMDNQIKYTILRSLSYHLPSAKLLLEDRYRPDSDFIGSVARQRIPKATLKSILEGAEARNNKITASNGYGYLLDSYDFKGYEVTAVDTLLMEAENLNRILRLTNASMSQSVRRLNTDTLSYTQNQTLIDEINAASFVSAYQPKIVDSQLEKHKVSSSNYLAVGAGATAAAGVIFGVANTYSGNYDIWITFLPASAAGVVDPKASSVMVTTNYPRVSSAGQITLGQVRTGTFPLDPRAVTKVKVAENVPLELCYDGFLLDNEPLYTNPDDVVTSDLYAQKYGVKITINNRTSMSQDLDHNLYIDCIELVPHRQD